MKTWQLRTVRVAVPSTLCVVLTATAHCALEGTELRLPALALALAGTALCNWLLARGTPGLGLTGAWMTATQIALYVLFDRTSAAPVPRPSHLLVPADPALPVHGPSAALALAHLLAAVLCTLLLCPGKTTRVRRLLPRPRPAARLVAGAGRPVGGGH
ncbi:hypothetical protein F4556_001442 [Kitasatospora gansuensis]|uniref:Uncharacterized protein n=1 Tax=Kitasatospora gansuensis TaxID=258050 RepID=A0A7W7S9E5_9ACTN|nr:hypothetical protein [Kitasatospora gansuensis]MBB4945907.1 hypothetical protein [Kitasatospora gansuensis]